MTAIRRLADLRVRDSSTVGAKAANLGELSRAGLPVPPGFVVGGEAYLKAMDASGVRDGLRAGLAAAVRQLDDDPAAFSASAERLRALVRDAGVPPALRDELVAAYHRLGDRMPVAVRSSAPGEDTSTLSFAGMHDTYTNVVGDDDLVARVLDGWVSLYGERVIAYRANRFLTAEPAIAILVQTMVPSDSAGVMFTSDPTERAPAHIVIEAGFGLGEVVMGGEVEPDTYVVSRRGMRLVQVRIGGKTHKAVPTRAGAVERVALGPADGWLRVLGDEQIIALARLGLRVESQFDGRPQDVEWAIAGDAAHVVQSRPISALGPRSPSVPPIGSRELLHGLAAAPGVATGRVRVLGSPEHWRRLNPGDVLVAPMTNPDWLPALRRSAAVVTDGGGLTCHGAIVARELGVPSVVATRVGTTRLRDGEVVTVDGDHGIVLTANVAAG